MPRMTDGDLGDTGDDRIESPPPIQPEIPFTLFVDALPGQVRIRFSRPIDWLTLLPHQAEAFAKLVKHQARKSRAKAN